jgi:putative oxidoreductase
MQTLATTAALHGGALLARLTLGQAFLIQGWAKLAGLPGSELMMTGLHLPAPQFFAVAVGLVELIGGGLLILGWGTRAAAGVLIAVLLGALILVHPAQLGAAVAGWPAPGQGLVAVAAWMHLLPLLFLAGWGPGALSLQHLRGGDPAPAQPPAKPRKP